MSLQKRQLLRKGLHALHWAVQFTQMQKQFLERRQYRRVLVYYFNQWRCAVNARQCHLITEAPNAVSKSCSVHPGMLAALQQLLGMNIYRFWPKQCKRLQHEDVQSPSLSGLRGKDCFEAQARFLAQDCASQHTLFRNHAENLESCFLHWRTLLHIKRGKRVDIPHLFQLCHAEVQQQTTAVSCQSYGKDNDHNKNEKYGMSLQLDDVHLTHEELHSHGSVRLEQSSQPQFQDDREELHKLQIAKIASWNQLQDALKLWPEEFFKPCLQGFCKYLPLRDSTVALGDEELDCSSLEQSTLQYGARPANRPGLERAGKWLQCKLEKHLVEEHLMLWAARVQQADQFHRQTLLMRVLLSWSKWGQTRQRHRELVAGFSFGRQRRVVLTLWKIRLLQKHEADRRCRKVLCWKTREAMSQWHQYTEKRKQVQDLQAYFLSVHTLRVKLLTLQTWKQKAETQRNVKIMADMQVQRRYLQAWRCAALQKEKMWQRLWTFQTVRNQQVLLGAFSQWRYHLELQHFSESHRKFRAARRVIQCWRQRTLLQQAVRHRATILIQTLFSNWKEAIRLSQLSHQIANNIKMRQLRLLLLAWAKLVKERKDESVRQKKMISASQHQQKQTAFYQMATLYQKQKGAALFYHLTLLRRCLLTWVGNVHLQKLWALTVSAQASLLQLNSAFAIWRTQLHFQRKMALFVQGQTKQILHKALITWYSELQALRYRARYVSQKFVSRWIVLVRARKQRDAEESRAEEHHRNHSCKLFFKNWRNQTFLQQFLEEKRVEKLQEIWKQWKNFTTSKLVTRGLYEQRLEVKVWQLWRRRFIQMQVSQAFAAQDNRILMLDVFTTWYRLAFGKQSDP
ncbi:protein SFI1 homolog isoform X2 [Mobula hypostoma]